MPPQEGRGWRGEERKERGQMFSSLVKQHFGMYLQEHIMVISGHLYHYHSRRKSVPDKSQMNKPTGPGFTICFTVCIS